jgi:pimeloyl-ACP methyl ester carboxylesterase
MPRAVRLFGLAALPLLVAAGLSGPARWQPGSTNHIATPRGRPCAIPGVSGPTRCATIDVPEAHDDPKGRRLSLRAIVLGATNPAAAPDPLVFLVGGPGQGAADLATPLSERLAFLRATRDVVLIDQRGTGASSGLHCPAAADARELPGRLFDHARLRACREALSQRADLLRYTTTMAAADYARVFDVLGYAAVNLWGVSYGTRLALELARQMPHRLRTLILDAVVPPAFTWPTHGAADADAALKRLVHDCEDDASCSQRFPAFARDVTLAFDGIERAGVSASIVDPLTREPVEVRFGANDLAYAVRGLLYGAEIMRLPAFFRRAAAGRYDDFAQAYVARARALAREIATGVHLGVYCAEDLPYVDAESARTLAVGTRIGTYLLDEYRRACEVWPRAQVPETFRASVHADVPALLFTGRRDPVTPPRTALDAARTLVRSKVVIWPTGGHGYEGPGQQPCKQAIILAFLSSASVERLPVACVPE